MIFEHKTLKEAEDTCRQLQAAGVEALTLRRGVERGVKKHWWLVETPHDETEVLARLLGLHCDDAEALGIRIPVEPPLSAANPTHRIGVYEIKGSRLTRLQ
jgi:hypothetical protein